MEILTIRYKNSDSFVIFTERDFINAGREMIKLDRKYASGVIVNDDGSEETFCMDGDWIRWECPFRWATEMPQNYTPYHDESRHRFNNEDFDKVCRMCTRLFELEDCTCKPPCPCSEMGEREAIEFFIDQYGLED
jgi:hypothetical protein